MSITAEQWTIDKQKFRLSATPKVRTAPKPEPTYMNEMSPLDDGKFYMIRAPARNRRFTNEELLAMPEVQRLREAMISQPGSVRYRVIDGKLLHPPL